MFLIRGGTISNRTTIDKIGANGVNRAWRTLRAADSGNYIDVLNSYFYNTRDNFTSPAPSNYRSPVLNATYYDVSILYFKNNNHVRVDNCILRYSGLNQATGKRNPYSWKGFGSGIKFYNCDHIEVVDTTIEYTLTEGIRLAGCSDVYIDNIVINHVTKNNEWMDRANPNKGSIASAITRYHNQPSMKGHYGGSGCNLDMQWVISNNKINCAANNGISISGRNILVVDNTIKHTFQHGIFAGDWRTCSNGQGQGFDAECLRDVVVSSNQVTDSFKPTASYTGWWWNTPDSATQMTDFASDIRFSRYDSSVSSSDNTTTIRELWQNDRLDCGCACP
jgi:hypothetical protein